MSKALSNRYALVTGGTRGIGLAISHKLAKNGYYLILGYNANDERAEKAKSELESKYNVRVFTVKGDVAEDSTINAFFESIKANFDNKLNAFVHNAGLQVGLTTDATSEASITALHKPGFSTFGKGSEDALDFNMYDYYQSVYPKCFVRCVERALPLMPDGEGYIVAISSPGCNATSRPLPRYQPGHAKAVLEHMVRCYAASLAPRRITANCIIPGLTDTETIVKMAE
ncbi:predicted protein, partial [Nematostella vectensis]